MGDDLTERLTAIEASLSKLQDELVGLRAENARLRAVGSRSAERVADVEPSMEAAPDGLGRRRLLVGGTTAGAAAVASLLVSGRPAAAANGDAVIAGQSTSATGETRLVYDGSGQNGFRVQGTSSLAMIEGYQSGTAAGVKGANTAGGTGVLGLANTGVGVYAESGGGYGVEGRSEGSVGVYGESVSGAGVEGTSQGTVGVRGQSAGAGSAGVRGEGEIGVMGFASRDFGTGVWGRSLMGTAVWGLSTLEGIAVLGDCLQEGTGVEARSYEGIGLQTKGGHADLRIVGVEGRQSPTSDLSFHDRGEVVADAAGALWFCAAAGTPGTWRKLGG